VSANNSFLKKTEVFVTKILWFWGRNLISFIVSIINEKLMEYYILKLDFGT